MINLTLALDHFNERPLATKIDTIILHSMYCPYPPEGKSALDAKVCVDWLDQCQVSSHYLITQTGEVYQLVDPVMRAWHAGKSQMPDGREGVNDFSIGIELLSPSEGYYPELQISALNYLIDQLKIEFPIQFILGHKDVAVKRSEMESHNLQNISKDHYLELSKNEAKTDPWNFPWNKIKK